MNAPARQDGAAPGGPFQVRIEPHGWCFEAGSRQSLFEAARQAGIRLPTLCRNGTCRTCIALLREGRVRYRVEWPGVSADEREQGYILPCVAVAESALIIELPEARRWDDPY
ncbi:2Fe-2S iron-sulfur cluster-binding protein [Pigmentiphaga soli]|uniref:2Fe-2S iron-sulfur cluster-binding protein n=1 Tax=Pigmentiphaga soli TaxID=1007095 RepID=A0ABP8GGV5_9BURK